MAKTTLKPAAITRAAFEYQDLVGIEVLIDFFRNPRLYKWVEVEAEDKSAGYLDDVVAARTDGKFEYIQVKFTADPDRYPLSWDWLLERKPRGTSRLKKWADTISDMGKGNSLSRAELRTNRQPDSEFGHALEGDRIKFSRIAASQRQLIEKELGGTKKAQAFFKVFRFRHSEMADVEGLERRLRDKVIPTDTTTEGWLLLREQVRSWASHKNKPEPDGKIRHEHLVQIITKKRPKPIPQNFAIPDVYAIPSFAFHERFLKRITSGRHAISVLWGTPGRGKSTYLSYLIRELTKKKLPVIRHHYFLSLNETATDRISFPDIAHSLMHQIMSRYPEAAKQRGLEDIPNTLRKWLEACGEYYAKEKKKFYVVIDGLDHVWRERMNIEQMDHLFNYLLPCPKNVVLIVGTQRVADDQLPARLLTHARPSAWIEVPPMDERAVQDWVKGQDKAGRLMLAGEPRNRAQRKEFVDEISDAFFEISHGHPLHLIYSFEALVRRGAHVTADEVRILPRCPDGDIRKYYRTLWRRLKPQGKKVLHLISGSEFRWPPDGLRRCGGSLDEVAHLLEERRTGIVPFHGSIIAFAKEQSDHASTFEALLPRIVRWLEREAPEYWRWGWLWIAKAKAGKDKDLITKTTRRWVVESLAQGWPDSQIVAILKEAEILAFKKEDYCRTIELRSLKIRMQNGPEFQLQRYSEFIEAALRSSQNNQQLLNMADDMGSLPDNHIIALLRSLPDTLHGEIGAECEAELRRRVNLWLALRHRSSGDFLTLVRYSFEALAHFEDFNISRMLAFIEGFNDKSSVFQSLLDTLVQQSKLETLIALAGALYHPKHKAWHRWVEDALVRVSVLEGADLTAQMPHPDSAAPLMSCYLVLRGEPCPATVEFHFDATLLTRDRHDNGPIFGLEKFFHDVFFHALALYRGSAGDFSFVLPGIDEANLGWMRDALEALRAMAKGVADGRLAPSFSTPFIEAQRLDPVGGRRTTEANSAQYWAFKTALRNIAADLQLISNPRSGDIRISEGEFAAARATRHWEDAAWLFENLKSRFVMLEKACAQKLLDDLAEKEDATVTAFNDRAERWIDLVLFALLYDLPPQSFAERAADCIVSYGHHKDPTIFDVLDVVEQLHEAAVDATPLLKKIAPVVDQITEITDGDGIGSARSELIGLIAGICPDKLPDCYAHHIRADELSLAEDALEAHVKSLDFNDGLSRSLARTLLGRSEILVLSDLSASGKQGADDALAEQLSFIGGIPESHEFDRGSDTGDFARSGTPPNIRKFSPSQFGKLMEKLSDTQLGYEHRDEALTNWIHYWKEKRKGREALNAVEKYFEGTESTYSAERMLDDAFRVSLAVQGKKQAYKWLVRAHIVRHGWTSNWTSSKEVIQRLEWAARYYKDRWKEFIRDTAKREPFWERRDYGFSLGVRYLVRFLILVDQKDLAIQYAATLVDLLVEEVGDQPLPEIPWLQ